MLTSNTQCFVRLFSLLLGQSSLRYWLIRTVEQRYETNRNADRPERSAIPFWGGSEKTSFVRGIGNTGQFVISRVPQYK